MRTYYVYRIGDIAFEGHTNKKFQYGRFVENTLANGIVSHIFDIYRPIQKEHDLWFWKYYIHNENIMRDVLRKSTTKATMMTNLVNKDLLKQKLNIPILEEQKKIGRLFSQIDRTITLHEEKQRQLEQLKKALLQKMFADETGYPVLRFKGFTEKCEQRKLGEIGETFSGLSGKNKNDFGHGDANFITYMNVFSNSIADLRGTEHVEIDSKQNQVIYGDILFTTSSETPEEVGMSSIWLGHTKNTYLNSFCFGYRILEKQNFDSYYMAYLLRTENFRKRMTVLAQGISRYNISKKQVMNTFVNFGGL
ncbi:restriction endonuclease subunit S [Limosilactobacillus pulli]|uniref:restriction endonuclease subunit S n=1 Tax=Limosilactobacillus pulli TaxID=2991833 RepID=UPI0024BA58AE|nr:restriction endonuclease subunit S [Limosilactobacillus pulli]